MIFIEAMAAFIFLAVVASQYSYYDLIGPGIAISRGSAAAIHSFNFVGMILVAYGLLTKCRSTICKKRC